MKIAEIIPVDPAIVLNAAQHRQRFRLKLPDSIVYTSVVQHFVLAGSAESCFTNRNSRDFDDPDIEESLAGHGCWMLFSFVSGANYVRHRVAKD